MISGFDIFWFQWDMWFVWKNKHIFLKMYKSVIEIHILLKQKISNPEITLIYIKKKYSVSDISKRLREFSSPWNHHSLGRDWVSSPALLTNSIGAFKIALLRKKCLRFFNHFAITRVAVGVKWKVFKQKIMGIHLQS